MTLKELLFKSHHSVNASTILSVTGQMHNKDL